MRKYPTIERCATLKIKALIFGFVCGLPNLVSAECSSRFDASVDACFIAIYDGLYARFVNNVRTPDAYAEVVVPTWIDRMKSLGCGSYLPNAGPEVDIAFDANFCLFGQDL